MARSNMPQIHLASAERAIGMAAGLIHAASQRSDR